MVSLPGFRTTSRFDASFATEDARVHLHTAGLATIEDAFRFGQPLSGRLLKAGSRHGHKEVVTAQVEIQGTSQQIYIKRQWKPERWVPRYTDVRRGMAFLPTPLCEWRGLQLFRAAGLLTAEPLAVFRDRAWYQRSAVITRAVPALNSLNEMLDSGEVQQLTRSALAGLQTAILKTIERVRAAELGWRSMKAKHFYPSLQNDGHWKIWLIDCEGVFPGARNRTHARDRRIFLESLHRNVADGGLCTRLDEALR